MSMDQKPIALISCTKSKTAYKAPARVLYSESALFRKALAHVEPSAAAVYVLSALHGLVTLDQVLEPYELTLKAMSRKQRQEWAARVLGQIRERYGPDLGGMTFAFHTGVEYREKLAPLLERAGATCICPVEGLAIGERMQFYDRSGTTPAIAPARVHAPSAAPGPRATSTRS